MASRPVRALRYAALIILSSIGLITGMMIYNDRSPVELMNPGSVRTESTAQLKNPDRSFDLKDTVQEIAFTPDGTRLIGGGLLRHVRMWDVHSGKLLWTLNGQVSTPIALSPDGETLACAASPDKAGRGRILAWDVPSRKPSFELLPEEPISLSLAFSPDGKTIASAGFDPVMRKGGISVWDVRTQRLKWRIPYLRNLVAFSPDGGLLTDGVSLWDAKSEKALKNLITPSSSYSDWKPVAAAFSPDGKTLVWAGVVRQGEEWGQVFMGVILWNLVTGAPKLLFERQISVNSLAYSPDGRAIAIGFSVNKGERFTGIVEVWEGRGDRVIRTFEEPESEVEAVAFTPDGRSLAWGNMDGMIKLRQWK